MSSQYQSEIKMKQLYGAYALCSQRHEQRYYLNTLVPEDKSSYMVKLNIKINKKLFDDTDIISIYEKNKEVFKVPKVKFDMTFMFEAGRSNDLTVKYIQIINNGFWDRLLFRKIKGKVVKKQNIYIDDIKLTRSEECPICLEPVGNNMYKSECEHSFHQKCIVDYIKFNGYYRELDRWCLDRCCHGHKVKPFPCPYCKQIIEDHDRF